MPQIGQWYKGLLFLVFQKMTKSHYGEIKGQFHNCDLSYMHSDVLVWYYSHHYGLVFVLLLPFQ